jgi:hypothetical protein
MMGKVPFDEIRAVVVSEIVGVTNSYVFLTDFALRVAEQPLFSKHYPFFVSTLSDAFRSHVLLAICRLFDPDADPRLASLTNFLQRVGPHHASDQDVKPDSIARRRDYEGQIPAYLADIRDRWKQLVIHRNGYLAHMDLTKTPLDMTYRFLRECFEQAQAVVGGYYTAYRHTARFFELRGLDHDAARLLEWCRLDDYERHFSEDMARRGMKFRREENL